MGATPTAGGVRYRVWAPVARRVEVELCDESRHVGLERDADGVWSAIIDGVGPGARYRFRLDGGGAFPDPCSRSQPDGVHGASEVIDPRAFEWHDAAWPGLS